ncbi:MAG: beta-galactosidase, partial [Elusimicrobia bacterium]|nr:beta-galactosidase [Elusimicrobiota bacterium]
NTLKIFILCFWIPATILGKSLPVEIKKTNTYPELWVQGKPFFIHGAGFFYPRIPRDLWESSLKTSKELGINTIHLYIPWNWHESKEGELDIDGHTNPRKDILGLMQIISHLGLKAMIQPGPYICAEWKNGGYPDWLLKRPEYKMARRSIAEGRYPPLSSLQYSDPEIAAKAWMENKTHLKYTERWYKTIAEKIVKPFSWEKSGPIILVQVDDDQPAGNRTNGPYFWKYMKWLRDIFIKSGVSLPIILNPSETSVPALGNKDTSKPHLWIMAQWYQRFYGADLSTSSIILIEPSAEYLKTSPEFPPSIIEFYAGFFALEHNPYGMTTHPSNTLTASRTLFQNGLKGLVNYPLQDSLYPAGYEIPSTNPHYAWESALDVTGKKRDKARSVERNGNLLRAQGELLAASHEWADVGLINPVAALDLVHLSTTALEAVKTELKNLEQWAIEKQISTEFVDPHSQPLDQLMRYPILLEPLPSKFSLPPFSSQAQKKIREYTTRGGKVISLDPSTAEGKQTLSNLTIPRKLRTSGWIYGSELVSNLGSLPGGNRDKTQENYGFVMLTNLGASEIKTEVIATDPYDSQGVISLNTVKVPPHDSLCLPLRVRLSRLMHSSLPFLGDSDEIYSATAELSHSRAGENFFQLGFYAPSPMELKLHLKFPPLSISLNHKEFSDYSWDAESGFLTLQLPAGKSPDFLQSLLFLYASKPSPSLEIPLKQPSLAYEFPTQVNDLIRPDITLPSFPPLVLANVNRQNTIPLTLENPSDQKKSVSIQWSSPSLMFTSPPTTIDLKRHASKKLTFEVQALSDSPTHAATLALQSDNWTQEIPIQVLWISSHQSVGYSFDLDRDEKSEIILENAKLRVAVNPVAGGRITQMVSKENETNIVATPGMLRELFTLMEPLDTTWENQKLPSWTRSRTPGLNTRSYSVEKFSQNGPQANVTLSYQTRDVSHQGAQIKKTISLYPDSSATLVSYEVQVASGDANQEFKIHHVIYLDSGAKLRYGQNGKTQTESLEKDLNKDFSPDWIGIKNSDAEWAVDWSTATHVTLKAKKNYAVLEITLGKLPLSNKTYSYQLRYHYGPNAFKERRRASALE